MEELDSQRFNEVVIGALDEVYGALESERFLDGDIKATHEAMDVYIKQVQRIRTAANGAHMRGLHFACAQIERNVRAFFQMQRALQASEYALLTEIPELLAQYALNQSCCTIDDLMRHLLKPAWPIALDEDQTLQLRQMLKADPSGEQVIDCQECVTDTASATASATPASDAENDPRAALHDALDALIVTISDDQTFGASNVEDAQALARYASKLKALANCAAQTGAAALASACNVFAQVVIQRAAYGTEVTEEERGLLNLFPILTMDSIADPDNTAADSALLAVANDPLWDSIHAVAHAGALASPTLSPEQSMPVAQDQAFAELGMDAAPGNSLELTDGKQQISQQMLALLAREIGLLGDALAQDLAAVYVPFGGSQEADDGQFQVMPDALINYLECLNRIGETAASVGLTALHALFVALTQNLAQLPALAAAESGSAAEQHQVLQQLPSSLQTYLADVTQADACLPLMTLLCEPSIGGGEIDFDLWFAALTSIEFIADENVQQQRQTLATEEDVCLNLPDDLNPELLEGLLQELPIQVGNFTDAIGRISKGQGGMAEMEQAKRAAHTLKGAANTVGVAGIANLTHHLEDILINLTEQKRMPEQSLANLLTEAGDCLEAMGEAVMGIGDAPEQALAVLQMVLDYANADSEDGEFAAEHALPPHAADANPATNSNMPSASEDGFSTAAAPNDLTTDAAHLNRQAASVGKAAQQVAQPAKEARKPESETAEASAENMVRVPAGVVDELLRLAGENIISNSQLQERLRLAQKQSKSIAQHDLLFQKLIAELENLVDVRGMGSPGKANAHQGDFDPLEFERYNELHTITSQLMEASTDARQMSLQIEEQLHALGELLQVQRRLQLENQTAVIRTRLVPVSSVVSRLQRCVRQACRVLNKQVELTVIGENTHVDSNMLQELLDPLMHILRNAVDHGIEDSKRRAATGKPAVGQIQLRFSSEGNAIVVQCQDDGAGLDYSAIHRSAISKNLLPGERAVNDEELARIILLPGFSTRDAATQVSGRGIGMDVVYSKILELKGVLHLQSVTGEGMLIECRLPTTLLSEHTLMAKVHGKMLAISSRRILDLHYLTLDQIDMVGNQEMYRSGDSLHKVYWLDHMLGIAPQHNKAPQIGYPALLTRLDNGETCAILVQELIDGRESVVKKLGRYVPKIEGTIGAVILGDGSVAPVLDLQELLRQSNPQFPRIAQQAMLREERQLVQQRSALVIDDSLSARRATAQTMRDAGFTVRTAIDGMDAVALLDQGIPDVILVDMEMPRMNGLEFTSHVRARADAKHVPIIMITSRSTEKHKQQGQAAGVNAYLLKPFSEDKLLEHVDQLLGMEQGVAS